MSRSDESSEEIRVMFRLGEFTSHAGLTLPWKIELDELSDGDWDCLAWLVTKQVLFSKVEGVPTGGLKFEGALKPFAIPAGNRLLIVDDVFTTGTSMERQRDGRDALGIVVFARAETPDWITPIFRLGMQWAQDNAPPAGTGRSRPPGDRGGLATVRYRQRSAESEVNDQRAI